MNEKAKRAIVFAAGAALVVAGVLVSVSVGAKSIALPDVAGNIGYIGLFVPHIMRRVVGNDYRVLMPASFVLGAAVLVWADIAARMVMAPYELPVGLFTAIVGVPVFLLLVRGEKH